MEPRTCGNCGCKIQEGEALCDECLDDEEEIDDEEYSEG